MNNSTVLLDGEDEDAYHIIDEVKRYNHRMRYVEGAIGMNNYLRKLLLMLSPSKQILQLSHHQQSMPTSPEEWHIHWQKQNQPWRTEPEIPLARQKELSKRLAIVPNIEKGLYPFKGIKLNRADVEWLLATHENGRGPVDWSDEKPRDRHGLDLCGAHLDNEDLMGLPLAKMCGGVNWFEVETVLATPEKLKEAEIHLK